MTCKPSPTVYGITVSTHKSKWRVLRHQNKCSKGVTNASYLGSLLRHDLEKLFLGFDEYVLFRAYVPYWLGGFLASGNPLVIHDPRKQLNASDKPYRKRQSHRFESIVRQTKRALKILGIKSSYGFLSGSPHRLLCPTVAPCFRCACLSDVVRDACGR